MLISRNFISLLKVSHKRFRIEIGIPQNAQFADREINHVFF